MLYIRASEIHHSSELDSRRILRPLCVEFTTLVLFEIQTERPHDRDPFLHVGPHGPADVLVREHGEHAGQPAELGHGVEVGVDLVIGFGVVALVGSHYGREGGVLGPTEQQLLAADHA